MMRITNTAVAAVQNYGGLPIVPIRAALELFLSLQGDHVASGVGMG